MSEASITLPIGQQVSLPGHFDKPVVLEGARPLGQGFECRIRRIEVKGRARRQTIRLTTNEWSQAVQRGDTFWLYVVWNPFHSPDAEPLRLRNPAKHLEHAAKPVKTDCYFDIPAAIEPAAARLSLSPC